MHSFVVVLLASQVLDVKVAGGPSMLPTIGTEAGILISRWAGVDVGDAVVCRLQPDRLVLKRVLATAGDLVDLDPLAGVEPASVEEEASNMSNKCMRMGRVPEGHLFLFGDNLTASLDSRHYGPVPREMVYGKAIGFFWWEESRIWFLDPGIRFTPLENNLKPIDKAQSLDEQELQDSVHSSFRYFSFDE